MIFVFTYFINNKLIYHEWHIMGRYIRIYMWNKNIKYLHQHVHHNSFLYLFQQSFACLKLIKSNHVEGLLMIRLDCLDRIFYCIVILSWDGRIFRRFLVVLLGFFLSSCDLKLLAVLLGSSSQGLQCFPCLMEFARSRIHRQYSEKWWKIYIGRFTFFHLKVKSFSSTI